MRKPCAARGQSSGSGRKEGKSPRMGRVLRLRSLREISSHKAGQSGKDMEQGAEGKRTTRRLFPPGAAGQAVTRNTGGPDCLVLCNCA